MGNSDCPFGLSSIASFAARTRGFAGDLTTFDY